MTDAEKSFLTKLSGLIADAAGYRDQGARLETDRLVREYIAGEIDQLREKMGKLKAAAEEEGEEDMEDDLDRIDARMERTNEALRGADYKEASFFGQPQVPEEGLGRVCASEQALLEDLELLVRDVMGMKYETIGTLTLREIEGTLAAIELKVANRKDVFEDSMEG